MSIPLFTQKDLDNATHRVTGHAELYKRDEATGKLVLVSTTRPCEVCGKPLEDLVIPKADALAEGQTLVHPECRNGIGGF